MNVVLVIIDSLRKDHVGAYGNDWIRTPNLDALAEESLRFTGAYPESIPTINARRAIHTGTRSWPFKDWWVPKGEDIVLQGWQPIPEGQTTLAEVLKEDGYSTMLVTDTMHQFKPSYVLWPEITDVPFMIRHPGGKGAGQTSDFYASTHDVAPTILGFLGIEAPGQMEGQDLSVIFDGGQPGDLREHFSLGYNDHAWARDDRYVMFAKNDGSNALLFDLREDPKMDTDIAGSNQDIIDSMWNAYILKDAGGPLPR